MVKIPNRKTQRPLVIWKRICSPDRERVLALCGTRRGAHNDLAYDALMAEVARREAMAPVIDPELARHLAEAKRLGLDVSSLLRTALQTAGLNNEAR